MTTMVWNLMDSKTGETKEETTTYPETKEYLEHLLIKTRNGIKLDSGLIKFDYKGYNALVSIN